MLPSVAPRPPILAGSGIGALRSQRHLDSNLILPLICQVTSGWELTGCEPQFSHLLTWTTYMHCRADSRTDHEHRADTQGSVKPGSSVKEEDGTLLIRYCPTHMSCFSMKVSNPVDPGFAGPLAHGTPQPPLPLH